ncbi:MAG: GATase protein [Actinomycetota bacterium]|mgnify:FL=1|jgi:GMP synthase-like glutamine amidotransferase|nr:GATase protein [Actinomycetota bacterium]
MRALFLQHDHVSPPGPVAERFAHRGYAIAEEIVVAPENFRSPNQPFDFPDPREFDALVVMGAPWGAWDDELIGNWLLPEIAWLREADELGVPVLGICFGGQLLARAHGGSVARAPKPEIGWTSIWTQEPQLVGPGPWFHWHYDRWQVPPGAREVARNAVASQAFVLRRNLAVQFHPELTAAGLQGWLENGGRAGAIADGQDPDILYQHTLAEGEDAARRAHDLVDAFIDQVAGTP